MPYCFDQAPSRLGTDSTKWDRYATRDQLDDVIPLWVADMDFACMPEVEQAIEHRAAHPIYGYSDVPRSLAEAIAGWERRQHGVEVDSDSIVWNTGVIYGLYSLVEWLVGPNEKVLVQLPAYPPFFNTPRALHREVVYTSLIEPKDESDDWRIEYWRIWSASWHPTRASECSSSAIPTIRSGVAGRARSSRGCLRSATVIVST